MSIFKNAMTKLLGIVVSQQKTLSENPKLLIQIMQEYDDLHSASNYHEDPKQHDEDNIKDDIIDMEGQVSREYVNLVYDAWAEVVNWESRTYHKHEHLLKKTPEIYIEMFLDPTYRFTKLYSHKKDVYNFILCIGGTGLEWTPEGYIDDWLGPSNTDKRMFWEYEKVILPEKIIKMFTWRENFEIHRCLKLVYKYKKEKLIQIASKDQLIQDNLNSIKDNMEFIKNNSFEDYTSSESYIKSVELINKIEKSQHKNTDDSQFTYIPLSRNSRINNIPANAHPSYILAAIEICQDILQNPKESPNNKNMAEEILKRTKI